MYLAMCRPVNKKDHFGAAIGTCKGTEVRRRFWWEKLKERDRLKDKGVDGRILLKWILKKEDRRMWTDFVWRLIGNLPVSFERSNELQLP